MFRPVSAELEFVAIEETELARWKANNVFERSITLRQGSEPWIFYEGRPQRMDFRDYITCGRGFIRTFLPLPDHARTIRGASSRLGYPWVTGRSPSGKAARDLGQERD